MDPKNVVADGEFSDRAKSATKSAVSHLNRETSKSMDGQTSQLTAGEASVQDNASNTYTPDSSKGKSKTDGDD